MASLADLYSSTGGGLVSGMADSALNESDAREDAGIGTQRLLHLYGTRALPDLVNRYAARGTFRSGMARVAGDRLREDVGWEQGDIQRGLTRQLSQFARNRILGAAGVNI